MEEEHTQIKSSRKVDFSGCFLSGFYKKYSATIFLGKVIFGKCAFKAFPNVNPSASKDYWQFSPPPQEITRLTFFYHLPYWAADC